MINLEQLLKELNKLPDKRAKAYESWLKFCVDDEKTIEMLRDMYHSAYTDAVRYFSDILKANAK